MNSLPELHVKVEPYDQGLLKKWHYAVQKKDGEYWQTVFTGWRHLEGYARTSENAMEKGKRAAANYCETLLAIRERNRSKEERTIFEKVTCQEEPV